MQAPKRFFPALFGFFLVAPLGAQSPLRVAAAADLEPVLPPILAQFQRTTGIHAEATYQASAMLTTQIENGAPFDLFFSADLSFPKRLIDAGLADAAGSADSHHIPSPMREARSSSGRGKIPACLRPRSISFARPAPEAPGHRQSRSRALWPRRRRRAPEPQALRRPQAAPRHRRKHRPGRPVRRLRQRRRRPHLAHLRAHAAPRCRRLLLHHPARPLSAHRAGCGHRQQNHAARRRTQAARLSPLPAVQAQLAKSGLTPVK